jgi:hypothetical protein
MDEMGKLVTAGSEAAGVSLSPGPSGSQCVRRLPVGVAHVTKTCSVTIDGEPDVTILQAEPEVGGDGLEPPTPCL